MERRLGRGLGSLLGSSAGTDNTPAAPNMIALSEIRPNAEQPRLVFDPAGLEELRDSIEKHGVLQPIIVRAVKDGYELIAGERRWRCARLAGLDKIPAIVREVPEDQRLELALVENLQRRDLGALEKARGYHRLMKAHGLTQEKVAEGVGLKRSTIANHLRLLDLPQEVQEALSTDLITMGHARAMLGSRSEVDQKALLGRIVREGLSVRQIEGLVRGKDPSAVTATTQAPARASSGEPEVELQPAEPWLQDLQRRMQIHLGAKVSMANREGFKGRIVIEYHGREDLDRLLELLAPRETV